MASCAYGIDLGTNNIKIYAKGNKEIFTAKNMIAIERKDILFAYGDPAFEMYEKAPEFIQISYPLNNGVIADINNMQTLVKCFISDLSDGNIKPADYYIAVPHDVTEVEKKAFHDLIKNANIKARNIMVVKKAVADGLGMDIDVKNSQGVLVVDIGFHTTEISILSLGGIVLSKMIKIGGQKFDDAIRNAVRSEFNLLIGQKTAEKVKISLKSLEEEKQNAVVYGRDIVTGLPVEREIPTTLVTNALHEHMNSIIEQVKVILEKTPPELGADIFRRGIYLTGGSSQLSHLDELMAKGTGLKVNLADDPIGCVACGLSRVINEPKFQSVAYTYDVQSGGK
ncbi:MAG: rod shape-determining protein [Lachnospiraceae bacterium]|nr:rod shape-determining protein [Lachnospiraceae bacterium]